MIDDIEQYQRMERNIRGAIKRHVKGCPQSDLAPEARHKLIDSFGTTAPAVLYLAEKNISWERLAMLVDEEVTAFLSSTNPSQDSRKRREKR